MSVLKEIMVLGQRAIISVGQKAVLRMISQNGGSVPINLSEKAVGAEARLGIKAMHTLGLIKLTPLLGESERYDMALTELGRRAVGEILLSLQGKG